MPEVPADFGLRVQPMVHVETLGAGIAFYETLGARLVYGSRDGDWALLEFDETTLSLLAHPPGDAEGRVELQFVTGIPLSEIETYLKRTAPSSIARPVTDEAFGRMLQLRSPDGLLIKLLELERDLIA